MWRETLPETTVASSRMLDKHCGRCCRTLFIRSDHRIRASVRETHTFARLSDLTTLFADSKRASGTHTISRNWAWSEDSDWDGRQPARFNQRITGLPAIRSRPQPGQLSASTGLAAVRPALVADDAARETDQDRGEDCPSCPIRDVSDGGSGHSPQAVPDDSATDRSAENEKSVTRAGMTPCLVAESTFLRANAGTVRFQTRFAAILGIRNGLRRPSQGEFMEREATSGYHLLNRPLVRSVQIPPGKCRSTPQRHQIRPPPAATLERRQH